MDLHKAIVLPATSSSTTWERSWVSIASPTTPRLGLGRRTGIDLPSEETGMMPSEEWKQRVYHQKWYAGETISVAIGQGAVVTTPLQLARTIGGIAMGGIFKQPHLLMTNKPCRKSYFPLSRKHRRTGDAGNVRRGQRGTARPGLVKLEGVDFAARPAPRK